MARLKDFKKYIDNRRRVIRKAEDELCSLQEKYESYFSEVTAVREREIAQLVELLARSRGHLPGKLDDQLHAVEETVSSKLEKQIAALELQRGKLRARAEAQRKESEAHEAKVRAENLTLDGREEALKARCADLMERITEHNARVAELGRGFGFFSNLPRMRALRAETRPLEEEHEDLKARIDTLRAEWGTVDTGFTEAEAKRRTEWVALEADAAALGAKLEYLRAAQPKIVLRSAVEEVLSRRERKPRAAGEGDPRCERCKMPHPPEAHFCAICARELSVDHKDLEGSLEEVAELNRHHRRFREGVQACQEIIGLVRGLGSGLDAFRESVEDMIDTEREHPVAALQIDVPTPAMEYGKVFDLLLDLVVADQSLHPLGFAKRLTRLKSERLTEGLIERYFETMGKRLSREANSQW